MLSNVNKVSLISKRFMNFFSKCIYIYIYTSAYMSINFLYYIHFIQTEPLTVKVFFLKKSQSKYSSYIPTSINLFTFFLLKKQLNYGDADSIREHLPGIS